MVINMNIPKGNEEQYSSNTVEFMPGNPMEGKRILFLGSSVTFGAASLEDGIPEYFQNRFHCAVTKEAVSGTTLVDKDSQSYVSRLIHCVDTNVMHDLVVCQLSTNDASQELPLGELNTFDPNTITGAIEFIIRYCREKWNCPVMFFTGTKYDSKNYEKMVARLYEIKELYEIEILDLWFDEAFNAISDEDRALYMNDPIHPFKAGYMLWWCPEMERQMLEKLSL